MVRLHNPFHVQAEVNGIAPPKETVNFRIIMLGLFGACAALMYGYDLGFIGGTVTLKTFLKAFDMQHASTKDIDAFSSNVVSVFQAGAVFGALFTSFVSDRIGRRKALILTIGVYIIGAVLMTAASGAAGKALLYVGRILTGWSVGASSMLVPIYVAECSPQHVRGRLVGLYEVGVQFGVMWGFWVNYLVLKTQKADVQWRLPIALQLLPAFVAFIALFFLTETPRYLVKRYGSEGASKVLATLRGLPADHPYVVEELAGITYQVEAERLIIGPMSGVVAQTFARSNWRRLFTGVMIMVFFQMAGTNAVNYYSPRIFQSLGLSAASAKLFATGVYGVVRFVATLIAMVVFTDRFGRVSMIVTGGSIMAACMWIVGSLIKAFPPVAGQEEIQAGQYAAIVFIFLWAVAFCFSYAGIPWIYCAEIFPLRIRTFCMAICTATHWAFNLMLAKATPYMLSNLGFGTYFVFAACTTVGAVWQFFCMPETRGKSLEEIEVLFSSRPRADTASVDRNSMLEPGHMGDEKKDFETSHQENA